MLYIFKVSKPLNNLPISIHSPDVLLKVKILPVCNPEHQVPGFTEFLEHHTATFVVIFSVPFDAEGNLKARLVNISMQAIVILYRQYFCIIGIADT